MHYKRGDFFMVLEPIKCKYCRSINVVRYGTQSGHSRFRCKDCSRIFKTEYVYRAYEPGVKEQIAEMAINGSGVRDTARVLGIGKNTVISELKKKAAEVVDVNPFVGTPEIVRSLRHLFDSPRDVLIDEQWSYVGNKDNQRWLWSAIDAVTGCVLAFAFGRRTNETLEKLLSKLDVFNIRTYYTDGLEGYSSLLPAEKHVVGKKYMQKIENRFLSTRTRVKRLARKTICFSKSEKIHDAVIGLYINRYCFETS